MTTLLERFRPTSRPRRGAEGADGPGVHRVVVVGGGFGGLPACRLLGRMPVQVTLVDRHNHHLFQPLLYQVATGVLSPGRIAPALRHILRRNQNVTVDLAEVTGIDVEHRVVSAVRPTGESIEFPYDSLIVAAGVQQSYFGHDEFARHAPGMKTIDDALELRRRIFGAFEQAETALDANERREWLTIVIVGAGPTGVELAGQVRELATRSLRDDFRKIDPASVRVILVDGGKQPLATFGDRLSDRSRHALSKLGVEMHFGTQVDTIDATGVGATGPGGEVSFPARTVIWAAGVEASPLAKLLADATGAGTDRAGRIEVAPDLTLPGHPEIFAVGDMIALDNLPGVAEVAMQGGLHAANSIGRRLRGEGEPVPFRYRDLGSVATIGRFRAVCSFGRLRLSGLPAWFVWMFVHLAFLNGFGNRASTMTRWLFSMIGRSRPERAFSTAPTGRARTGGDRSTPSPERAPGRA